MNIEDYDKKIVLAFGCGAGGLYVREHYDEAVRGSENLQDVVNYIIEDIKYDLDNYPDDVDEHHKKLLERVVNSDEECIGFINEFLHNKEAYPELCGTVAGILFREGKLKEALDFLEVSDMEEERYWDS
jgi:hypothetical protein